MTKIPPDPPSEDELEEILPDPPTEEEVEEIQQEVQEERENWNPTELPESQAQLVKDIKAAGGPDWMVEKVGKGIYHDYVSPSPMPKHVLVEDAENEGLYEIAKKARNGAYDP
jgi:hypothetical protein